jgi:phage-related baseplate assembly protein
VAITSSRQPLVDDLTVRQTGAIAYALSALVDERITAQQEKVFAEAKDTPKSTLDKLSQIEVIEPG